MTTAVLRLRGEGAREDGVVALLLVRTGEAQFHLGLRHQLDRGERVLHLAWHRRLFDENLAQVIARAPGAPALPAAMIAMAIDPLIDEALRVLARRVARRYANKASGSLPYGFGEASATFDQSTAQLSDPDAAFTCATFVLALLRSVGVLLIDPSRWRAPTNEDERWQREIGAQLVAWIARHVHGDLPGAEARLARDIGQRRYRPTDVAGAALLSPASWPAGVDETDPKARSLEAILAWPRA